MTRLAGKIAVVTGSGIGIGAAIAERFAQEGAFVYVTDINGETAKETVARITAAGGKAADMVVDVSKGQDVLALVRRIESEQGRADILVNNAGILVRGEIRNLSDAEWTKLREVNLDGVRCRRPEPSRSGCRHRPALLVQHGRCARCAAWRSRRRRARFHL